MKGATRLLGLLAVWIGLSVLFALLLPNFATLRNFETIIRQTMIVGLAGIGLTFVIIAGEIDLSVGSAVALVTVVIAWALREGWNPLLAAGLGILTGAAAGFVNGFLTERFRVSSFIATLCTLLVFRGLAKGLANEQKIDAPMTWLAGLTASLPPERRWLLLPTGAWLMLALAGVAAWVLYATVAGRHVVAVGSNEATARMCGIDPRRVRMGVFTVSGILMGLAGLMQFSRLTVGDPTVAVGLELSVIAAVVVGGASLRGGQGSIAGSLIGALIMTTIASGFSQLGWRNWQQEIITGAIILGAVAWDRARAGRP